MNKQQFQLYLEAFNARDYETLHRDFFAPDVKLYTLGYVLNGQKGIREFYSFFHEYIKESLTFKAFHPTEDGFFAEVGMNLKAIKDLTHQVLEERGFERLPAIPLGMVHDTTLFIHYEVRDGKLYRIRCAEFPNPEE